ncbi:hypothetical protein ACVWZZ_003235 [Bradyrhizobium sp. LM6.10]
MESKEFFEEIGDPRFGAIADQLIRSKPVHLILEAVSEGVSGEAAERMADMKKVDMPEAAEQLLAATDWLPALLRTGRPQEQSDAPTAGQGDDAYSEAAE